MSDKRTLEILEDGRGLNATDIATFRFPTVPTALAEDDGGEVSGNYIRASYVTGPTKKVKLTLVDVEVTVADATVGVGLKILDFLTGLYRFKSSRASLTFKTTSVLADTLNLSKTINWALGTATQTTATLLGTAESDIMPVTTATSSATIDVANSATHGESYVPRVIDGSTTAPDIYLNISVPTATDIDANATVKINGTIEIVYEDLGASSAAASATRMPSVAIWQNCPWDAINAGRHDGFTVFDDLVFGHYTQAANVAASATTIRGGAGGGGMCAFTGATAGGTVGPALDDPTGVVKLLQTTDGESTTLQFLGNGNIAGQAIFGAGKRLWFEARIKMANITTNEHGVFLGFGEEGLTVAGGIIGTSDALADKDLVGFHKTAVGTTAMGTYHNTASGGGITTIAASAATVAADTWTKLGIYCDGTTVYFFQDGVQLATSVLLAATNFPDGEEMAGYLSLVTGSGGGDCIASIDWFKFAQQRE